MYIFLDSDLGLKAILKAFCAIKRTLKKQTVIAWNPQSLVAGNILEIRGKSTLTHCVRRYRKEHMALFH